MTETTPLSAPGILAIAVAFALGVIGYGFVIAHPEAEHLVRWAQAPISTATR
jgi:hypothetical protein